MISFIAIKVQFQTDYLCTVEPLETGSVDLFELGVCLIDVEAVDLKAAVERNDES